MNTAKDFYNRLKPMPNGCLEWTWYKDRNGYGQMRYDGVVKFTHRLAYELKHGAIPQGMYVCHHCDNPSCCNTDHLFLGTNSDNMNDCIHKNRGNTQKITRNDAIAIRNSKLTAKQLAKIYNITSQQIYKIKNNNAWRKA